MLIEFKVENYRSIREEQTLSFVGSNYDNELPNNYIELDIPGMAGIRVMKVAAIYGANASGKSNVVDALEFFARFAANSFTELKPEATTGTVSFRFEKEWTERPTLFEITFIHEKTRYTYGLGLTTERVTEEYLIAYPLGKAQTWFEREWDATKQEYQWSEPTENFPYENALVQATRGNCTFLSAGAQFQHPKLSPVRDWFVMRFDLKNFSWSHQSPGVTAWYLDETPDSIRSSVHLDFLELLKRADLGILDFKTEKLPDGVLPDYKHLSNALDYKIMFRHKGGDDIWLKFSDESNGTQRLFSLAAPWMLALNLGEFICIDEIESSLHPFLARELIRMFLDPKINAKGAQLLFTTHNTILLDQELLRRDQFWFTEKDDTGATRLYPLTDYSPRKGEALMKGYLAGRYGGIPFIPERLVSK